MTFAPYLRIPLTDLTGCIINSQFNGRCAKFELDAMECLEAYGIDRGLVKCKDLMDDFEECFKRTKQLQRLSAMMDERERQLKAGERTKEDLYPPFPRHDGY